MTSAPNLLFVMSDDHACHAISAYGSVLNRTPHLDRLAIEGMRFDAAFCTNSICAPSRAAILTGTYNHRNGVTTLDTPLDNRLWTFPQALQQAGYQTALFGKWHLGHGPANDPTGFDTWRILPGQGHYHNPVFLEQGGVVVERGGYVTDLITDDCIDYLQRRDRSRPFALFCHHKAPHRSWEPAPRHFDLYEGLELPYPPTFTDDLDGRAAVVQAVKMRMMDLDPIVDLKSNVPAGLSEEEEIRWRYQRYIKDYLRVVAAIDDSMGRLLEYLETDGCVDNTVVVYTSDQGFFLGDHGWFDKRLMYEESLAMPLLVRYPAMVAPGSVCEDIVVNVDFAPTMLDLAGVETPFELQGNSLVPLLSGDKPDGWQQSMYYRYWMHNDPSHACPAHFGIRSRTHKLICYYNDPMGQPGAHGPSNPVEWELFDLVADPGELSNIIHTDEGRQVAALLFEELQEHRRRVGDIDATMELTPPAVL